ncbi:MAG: hypothetical protein M1830_003015 [Pleopsidium flavum]|nr:MAG: hypothetical protein M1830_003015 [Pleopsidium flavum]
MSKLQKNSGHPSIVSRSRGNSAGAAFRRADVQISDPISISRGSNEASIPQSPFTSLRLRSNTSLRRIQMSRDGSVAGRSITGKDYADTTSRQSLPRLQHKRSMDGLREASNPRRGRPSESPTTSFRTSTPLDYVKSHPSELISGPKRERSTLKTVMRRLFGKKTVRGRRTAGAGPMEHHRSDPGVFITTPATISPHRESSLAITELTRSSALGSHSPFAPEIYHSHDLATTQEDQSQPPREPFTQRRRVTLPSIDYSPDEARIIAATLAAHEHRPSNQGPADALQCGNIGFAVTSGSNPKRRSRSAGALRDAASQHRMSPIQWRRRSDEIKYWRESLGEQPFTVPSYSLAPTADLADEPSRETEDPVVADEPNSTTLEDSRRTFDFGPVASSMRNKEAASLDERLVTLEVKLMDLEYAISKLQAHGSTPAETPALEKLPKSPSTNASEASAYSSTLAHQEQRRPVDYGIHTCAEIQLLEQPSSTFDKPLPETASAMYRFSPMVLRSNPATTFHPSNPEIRPSSTVTTISPSTAQISLSSPEEQHARPIELTFEHYTALTSFIQQEESARKQLEQQVRYLQRQVHDLRSSHALGAADPYSISSSYVRDPVPPSMMREQQRHGGEASGGFGARRSLDDCDEEMHTDDGFQDVYETPKERKEFDIGGFI